MLASSKVLGLLLVAQFLTLAIITCTNVLEFLIAGICVYAFCVVLMARYIDKYAEWRESTGIYTLILLSTIMGSATGALISRTLYSTLVALSTALIAFTYTIMVLKAMSR